MADAVDRQKVRIVKLLEGKNPASLKLFKKRAAIQSQIKTLQILLGEGMHTAFGNDYSFKKILESKDVAQAFQQVPIHSYLDIKPYWQRAYEGEKNVCWPEDIKYFALSSGTTDASSKYIPVSKRMLKNIRKAGVRQLWHIAKSDLPKDHLTKNYLFVGGSTDLEFNGNNYAGDLSGITTSNIPLWMRRLSKPEPEIKNAKEWNHKINLMVENAPNWDIAIIAGVPAWIQLLFERIIETYQLNDIHDIWPNLSVYVHGGVSFKPYRKSFEKLLARPLKYFETYLASEGFVAFQVRERSEGMRLVFRNGIYYEFVPFNEENFDTNGDLKEGAKSINIQHIEEGVDYALIISTCSGAWRYLIGDTVRFVDAERFEIAITGRTKHFLSLCGEHLSVENMSAALEMVSKELELEFGEFTVKGTNIDGKYGHHWHVACTGKVDSQKVLKALDEKLMLVNDDYRVERKFALKDIQLDLLHPQIFTEWMEKRGKLGSQNKFPRVMNDQLYMDWVKFVQLKKSVNGNY